MDQTGKPPLRAQVWAVIAENRGHVARAYNFLSLVLIVFSLAILPLQLIPDLADNYPGVLLWMEIFVTGVFTLDYLLHLWSAPSLLRYMFSFFGIVDLLSVLPFYLGFFVIPYLRALRIVRILRLGEIDPAGSASSPEDLDADIDLAPGETVDYIVTRHPLFLIINTIPSLVAVAFGAGLLILTPDNPVVMAFSIALILFGLLLLWKAWLDFSYDLIYVTSARLIFQNKHLLGRSINQVPYQAIMNIKPSYPSIISYIFRYGSISIDTASAETDDIKLDMVRHHEHAAHIIMQKSVSSLMQNGGGPFQFAKGGK